MKYDIFDIFGPVMIGPSSSHTSGAVRLGLFVFNLLGGICEKAEIYLHGSYADVYKGHGTDIALIAGLLGLSADNPDIINAKKVARDKNMQYKIIKTDLGENYHPNTVKFVVEKGHKHFEIIGQSIGAGNIEIVEINAIKTDGLTGKLETLLIIHKDIPGVLSEITAKLAQRHINIADLSNQRNKKTKEAITIISTDEKIQKDIISEIKKIKNIKLAKSLPIFE